MKKNLMKKPNQLISARCADSADALFSAIYFFMALVMVLFVMVLLVMLWMGEFPQPVLNSRLRTKGVCLLSLSTSGIPPLLVGGVTNPLADCLLQVMYKNPLHYSVVIF
jgi:hypothetical protein